MTGSPRPPWVANLAEVEATRSNTSVCTQDRDPAITSLSVDAQWAFVKDLVALIEKKAPRSTSRRIATHPPGLRILVRLHGSSVQMSRR